MVVSSNRGAPDGMDLYAVDPLQPADRTPVCRTGAGMAQSLRAQDTPSNGT
jgi:hypothetical protein